MASQAARTRNTFSQPISQRSSRTSRGTLYLRVGFFMLRPYSFCQMSNHRELILNICIRAPDSNASEAQSERSCSSFRLMRLRGNRPMHLYLPSLRHDALYILQSIENRIEMYHSYKASRTAGHEWGLPCPPSRLRRLCHTICLLPRMLCSAPLALALGSCVFCCIQGSDSH